MNFEQLKYFLTINKTSSFTKAAKELFISQPHLSQSISKLEDELGVKLFNRTTHSVSLTNDGKVFLKYASRINGDYVKLMEELEGDRKMNDRISVGIVTTFSDYGYSKMLDSFERSIKGLTINKIWGGSNLLLNKLLMAEIQACIIIAGEEQLKELDLKYEKICVDNLMLMLSKDNPLSEKEKIRLSDLIGEDVYIFSGSKNVDRTVGTARVINDAFHEYGIYDMTFKTYSVVDESVHRANSNEGIFFILEGSSHLGVSFNNIIFRHLSPDLKVSMYLVSKKDYDHPLLKKLFTHALRSGYNGIR